MGLIQHHPRARLVRVFSIFGGSATHIRDVEMSYFAAQIPPDLENKTHAPPIFARTALAGADDGVARFMGQLVHLWRQFGDGAIH